MKIKNNLILLCITSLLVFGCSKNKAEDQLILPPNFDEMPDPNNKDNTANKPANKDIEELKDLLLKKQ
jgi:hypothetical protein